MPGVGKAAVVILWVQFGFGACAILILGVFGALFASFVDTEVFSDVRWAFEEVPWARPLLILLVLMVALVVGLTVLNAVLAVKIAQRKRWARITAITLQAISIGLSVTAWIVAIAYDGFVSAVRGDLGSDVFGLGICLAIIILLSRREMAWWCDR